MDKHCFWFLLLLFSVQMVWVSGRDNRTMGECHRAGLNCTRWGSCYWDKTNYTCTCVMGFKGDICDTDVNECEIGSAPCKKRGVCHNSIGSFRCDCLPGWKGSHCQTADGSGLSTCVTGYTGVNCTDDFDECTQWAENPCEHGSTCVNTPGNFSCSCATGWEGRICNQDVDECNLTAGLCHNGGNCTNIPGSYKCVCPYPYTGAACDDVSSTTSTTITTTRPPPMSANVTNGLPSLNTTGSIFSVSNPSMFLTTISANQQNSTSGDVSKQVERSDAGDGDVSNVGVIVGPVAGILVIAAAAVTGLFVYRKYFRKHGRVNAADETEVKKTGQQTSGDDANKNTKFNPSSQTGAPNANTAPAGNGVNVDNVP